MRFVSPWKLHVPIAAAALTSLWFLAPVRAQTTTSKPAAVPTAPNLIATFTSKNQTDARLSRLPDLFVVAGESPAPFLAPGPFKVTFTGDLNLRIRDTYKFTFAGRGAVKLSINNKPVLDFAGDDLSAKTSDDVKMLKGKNAFVLEYTSPTSGNAELRTYWLSKDFLPEPIPPTLFSHDPTNSALAEHTKLHTGRYLFASLRCIKCHTSDELQNAAMPELATDAPNLTDVGARLNPAWMAAWIANPKAQRPTATMPRVFATEQGKQIVADIATYLGTLGTPMQGEIPSDDQTISTGGHLFTTLGCIACHNAPDAKEIDPTRIPLSVDKLKYRPAALKAFLQSPEKNYAWIRMPNFRLTDAEATALTSYLIAKGPDPLPPITGDAARGQQFFTLAGCLNCHTAGESKTLTKKRFLTDAVKNLSTGCLAATDDTRGLAPDFSFTP
jgi:mono/diheme cytochrome c family protein